MYHKLVDINRSLLGEIVMAYIIQFDKRIPCKVIKRYGRIAESYNDTKDGNENLEESLALSRSL